LNRNSFSLTNDLVQVINEFPYDKLFERSWIRFTTRKLLFKRTN